MGKGSCRHAFLKCHRNKVGGISLLQDRGSFYLLTSFQVPKWVWLQLFPEVLDPDLFYVRWNLMKLAFLAVLGEICFQGVCK